MSDVLGLVIAWGAATLGRRRPSGRCTYGLRSSSILAAFLNAPLLLVATAIIAVEAIRRFAEPTSVASKTVIIVADVGILINGVTALLFMRGRKGDLHVKTAFLHVSADAGLASGVVVAGLLIVLTGKTWIDPIMGLIIVLVIAVGIWGLLRNSVNMNRQRRPATASLA